MLESGFNVDSYYLIFGYAMTPLPSYKELKNRIHLGTQEVDYIKQSRQTIRDILNGKDPRLLLIIGPCSIHDAASAKEFASRLKILAEGVSENFFIAMRVHCEKPRTSFGWKGYLYDPHLDGSNDMTTGITWTRRLLLELTQLQIPAATEFLDPLTAGYFEDLISWGSIGARTSSSQPHRQLASSLGMPVGIKNSTSGNISDAVNGVVSASQSHTYMTLDANGKPIVIRSSGNPDAHIVLRGGENGPNFDETCIKRGLNELKNNQQPTRLLVDCSHQNSGKQLDRQPHVFQSVLDQFASGNSAIRGLLLESHLLEGSQNTKNVSPPHLKYGISITDDCLGWSSTERIVLNGHSFLSNKQDTIDALPYAMTSP
jgi:3-deoxy-7-phosphoheptulonate synthase